MDLNASMTRNNLLRAFAGEGQARNRYTFAAQTCKSRKLQVLERVFLFTADQERAHAQVFYSHLRPLNGQNIPCEGSYPIDGFDDALGLLRAAQHNEYQEHDVEYRLFAQTAREEGFEDVAVHFEQIAAIEKSHGDRFGRYADLLESGRLFTEAQPTAWLCLNCGHVHCAAAAPEKCPVCSHDQGYFVRLSSAEAGL